MLSKLLCAKRRKSHNSTKYCESIIKSVEIKQMAVQHYSYDQHLSQFWNHLVKYFRTGRPIQTDNSNGIGGGRTTPRGIIASAANFTFYQKKLVDPIPVQFTI